MPLGRLKLATQLRTVVALAMAATLLVIGGGAYMIHLYEKFHRDFTQNDSPFQQRVTAAITELTSIHLTLADLGESQRKNGEALSVETSQLRNRWKDYAVSLGVAPQGNFDQTLSSLGTVVTTINTYGGNLLQALDALDQGRDPHPHIQQAAQVAVEAGRQLAQLQNELNLHQAADIAALRASLREGALPALALAFAILLSTFMLLVLLARRTSLLFTSLHRALDRLADGDTGAVEFQVSAIRESARIASALESFRRTLLDLSFLRATLEREVDDRTQRLTRLNTELELQIAALSSTQRELRLYKRVFEGVNEAIVITRLDGTIIEVNDAYGLITGYTREEVIGQNPRLASSGRHDSAFYEAMWTAIREQGRWSGEVWDRRRDGEVYPKLLSIGTVYDEASQPTHYVGVFTDISALKATEAQLESMAYFDHLTELPNRRLLRDRVEHAIALTHRKVGVGAVFFLDLDKFKNINDTQGHRVGDQLLVEVARRLKACVRDSDTVGRLAGDEFLVIAEQLADDPTHAGIQAHAIGEKIVASLSRPYAIGDSVVHTTPSIGIALFGTFAPSDADSVLNKADTAMYEAKKLGRGVIRFFDPEMHERQQALIALETVVRNAIHQGGFHLHLQPQITTQGQVVGVEALIRLNDVEGHPVPPGRFIPVAEETALILDIER